MAKTIADIVLTVNMCIGKSKYQSVTVASNKKKKQVKGQSCDKNQITLSLFQITEHTKREGGRKWFR